MEENYKSNKKYKYIHTLFNPENSKFGKIPSKFSTPTTIFKRKRKFEYITNDKGIIGIQWTPQAFYFTNNGLFIYNLNTYTGLVTTTPTTTGFGIDTSGFVQTGTPIRLVAASMKILYGGLIGGISTGGRFITSLSSAIPDNNMSLFSNINLLNDVKTVRASDGIKIIYTPYGPESMTFYKINTNLGRDGDVGNGLLTTQRFVFYGSELSSNQNCIQVIYTQIFEAITCKKFL